MKRTKIIKLEEMNEKQIDEILTACGEMIREGKTVAFPTETVYGLGANALDSKAINKIFVAKGRPSDNPLIVHVAHRVEVDALVRVIPEKAKKLMAHFWPGPLTLVMEKSHGIPGEISAGLSTVAIRMPVHPIARTLIEKAGVPVAAPSANTSGKPSPTRAAHVIQDLRGKVDAIIAGGPCDVGVESTVLDVTEETPMILRPGGVTKEMLEAVIGEVALDPGLYHRGEMKDVPRSPGMKYTHYAPKAKVIIIEGVEAAVVRKIREMVAYYKEKGLSVGVIVTDESLAYYDQVEECCVKSMGSRQNPETIANNLFRVLREFDETNVAIILSEAVEEVGIGQAVMNRLMKAAGNEKINA
ncbi:Sua5/YciO/YrdC/YwlC family protein [Alkaliphilus metalliredigens QYMF]|uniref:Threonylcarbamoyl-AMP synthase n=1 Tax=Alkaliphilus metalliredigens (strain QYMF) TaxID=293826 RepID=A6TK48_ALKMQ|nr:L-threonylcarbamoyladenylate synthase [Alkaliphilus metalliredigens]ABR46566.1 Sua5/YciO/YrdC/YwlC family protein [Alkaliphilus metalliredigens QYMF]